MDDSSERWLSSPTARAAFFDLDRTLIPGSSLFLLARAMYDRDLFRIRDLVGHPHAVNPDDDLFGHAMRHGWAVHELRPARRLALVRVGPVGGSVLALALVWTAGYLVGLHRGRRIVR